MSANHLFDSQLTQKVIATLVVAAIILLAVVEKRLKRVKGVYSF